MDTNQIKARLKTAGSIQADEPEKKSFLQREISFGGGAWNDGKKEQFYSSIHTLLDAGLDLYSTLEIVRNEEQKKKIKTELEAIQNQVGAGMTLSEALATNKHFSSYETQSLKLGEESADVITVLEQLIRYYKNRIAIRKLTVRVLAYPTFVFGVSAGVIWFMMTFVVPVFADVFARFDAEIPALTAWVISASGSVAKNTPWVLLVVLALVVLAKTQQKKPLYRKVSSQVMRKLPWFGSLMNKIYLARFAQSMALLLKTGTPLVRAIGHTKNMISYYPMEVALEQFTGRIQNGEQLHQCMKDFKVFEPRMVSLVKVAEEVNQLDKMMQKLAIQLEEEIEHKTSLIGSILEPVLIVFIALFVGIVLVSMYLPLFELSNVIGS